MWLCYQKKVYQLQVLAWKYAAVWQSTKIQSCLFWKQNNIPIKTDFHILTEVIQINNTEIQLFVYQLDYLGF